MIDRRRMLGWLGVGAALPVLAACGGQAQARGFAISYSDAEWRRRLTREQYYILRGKGTEAPFTSPLLKERRKGVFVCAADGNRQFSSDTKYDSKTGWPSFWRPLPGAIATGTDWDAGYPRTEVHCARCGGHLGHVFDDGPRPTGLRYCMNGDAMAFVPA
ncbi:peptide-methionine (R)-S-oxide reductase MsrB [Novosphingobium sp.]|jgi:peptide-methionine (R)-S-oxide reductase|uniref:peptide-methionine (R)-S-oxide reductase MsrB n=1 Tax=Novosphingobium sp. TaxID=1874826 RepID=UPI001EC9FF8C|nr:peptide-methionine (R)-S-oxide reductase MsrB [Novosphingobium sp.]MBK6803149.1 peptide-methionine (R)-S-oxide reductase MsrB [Novosphingobium sp.]MBK9012001.1 peptide-methionine (R)-S-oxide reductase MsrB [Novosphingobium sp.]